MHIAHVHWAFPPTTGGVESHLFDLARLQSAAGHSVTIVTGEPEPIRTGAYEIVSTPLLQLESIRDSSVDDEYAHHLGEMFLAVADSNKFDVVHGHDLHHFTPEPAIVLTDLRQKLKFSLHHSFHETWPDVLADRPVYRSWDGNYAVSRFVRDGCARRIGFEPMLFPLGVDTTTFCASRSPFSSGRSPILVHPARMLPWKGVHFTIHMLAQLRTRGLRPTLVLTDTRRIADWDLELDTYRDQIHSLVRNLQLTDQVEFVRVAYTDMPHLYDRADVVLYPTVADEPFGLVPLEAMSCGRPIVASRCGGIAETVVDGITGFTVAPGDVDALTNRVAELLRDPGRALAMGRAGREHVRTHYEIHDYADRLNRLYVAA